MWISNWFLLKVEFSLQKLKLRASPDWFLEKKKWGHDGGWARCRTASKNPAFQRLLTLNQFSLVTGTGLTAAAPAVCIGEHSHLRARTDCMCTCEKCRRGEAERDESCVWAAFVVWLSCLILPPFCCLVASVAALCFSHGSHTCIAAGLTSCGGYYGNTSRCWSAAMATDDARGCFFFCGCN